MNVLLLRLSQEPRTLRWAEVVENSELEDFDYLDSYDRATSEEGRYREAYAGIPEAAAPPEPGKDEERLVETLNPLSDVTGSTLPAHRERRLTDGTRRPRHRSGRRSRRDESRSAAAVARIRQSGAPLWGVLFNKRRYYIPDVLYRML
jgi:hypothetical protein